MENPTRDLLDQYRSRREAIVKKTAGAYLEDRKAILGAADGMVARVDKARGTLHAVEADERAGHVSTEQARRLRKAVLEDVRSHIDRTAGATSKFLKAMPDRLLGDAYPVHHERSSATAEAKADLDRELEGISAGDLPLALAATARRRYAEGDALAGDLLLSSHGRDRLTAAGFADAERLHADLRRTLSRETPGTLSGERAEAAAALAHVDEWEKAFTVALNASDMMLRDLEAGRNEPDA